MHPTPGWIVGSDRSVTHCPIDVDADLLPGAAALALRTALQQHLTFTHANAISAWPILNLELRTDVRDGSGVADHQHAAGATVGARVDVDLAMREPQLRTGLKHDLGALGDADGDCADLQRRAAPCFGA